jgi:hypothetical protein
MFTTVFRNGSEQSMRYTRSVNGRETWTPRRQMPAPRTEMVAKYDGSCKLADCGDRAIIANVTVIVKRNGVWNHKSCPAPKPVDAVLVQMNDDDREMAEMEMADDRAQSAREAMSAEDITDAADALLAEYEASRRAAAVETVVTRKLIYRVSLTGEAKRYGVDVVNVEVVPNAKYNNAKIGEFRGEGVGRIDRDGQIRYWPNVDQDSPRVKAVVAAVEILLGTADPIEYAKAYATEASECMRCGDDLVDDQKNPYYPLLGPVCGRKFSKGE